MGTKQNKKKVKILVLDDDATISATLYDILSSEYHIELTKNYSEFKNIVHDFNPHIIFLDLILPDGNGIDICKNLREDEKFDDRFILIMTSSTDDRTIKEGYSSGADDFIRKPFLPFEIKSKISLIEKIILARKNINSVNRALAQKNRKLYSFSSLIKSNLNSETTGSTQDISEFIKEIIKPEYFELIKIQNKETISIQKESFDDSFSFIEFKKIFKKTKIKNEQQTQRIKIRNGDTIIYCLVSTLYLHDQISGYILLENPTPFKSGDIELFSLVSDFVSLLNERVDSENKLKKRNEEYREEISKIRTIQVSQMPDFQKITNYNIASAFLPAYDLSGDFMDAFFLDDNVYQIILCDVSGHGIASSYVGNEIRTLFRTYSSIGKSLSEITAMVNDSLAKDLKGLYYYGTIAICRINLQDGNVKILNGGHPPIIQYHANEKKTSMIEHTGGLVGIFKGMEYLEKEITMEQGDSLLLYTDGITEAEDVPDHSEKISMYGEERLIENFIENQNFAPIDMIRFIISSVYEFSDYEDQNDDITAICIQKA